MSTIPASAIVNVTPSVLSAGGDALDLNGLLLSTNTRLPIGAVLSFATPTDVDNYFGATAAEAVLAGIYFNGFDNSTVKPGALLMAQYPQAAGSAYIRGGNISGLTLAQLQALSGTFSIIIDGVLQTSAVNLAAATSFSNAAQIIENDLNIHGVQAAAVTGSIGGTTLTVSAISSGAIAVGDLVSGTGVTAQTYITAMVSGTGGAGTYTVNNSQIVGSVAMTLYSPGVEYDSVSGAFIVHSGTTGSGSTMAYGSGAMATSLLLTLLTGAVLSQGAAAATPAAFMDAITAITQNWASFATVFDPDASGNANKLAFAAWTNGQNKRYAYVVWDTDASPTTTSPATSSLGYLIKQASYNGITVIGEEQSNPGSPLNQIAAFVLGAIASIDFQQANGRADVTFRSQAGLTANVTSRAVMDSLIANGYNFYGAYGTANDQFVFFYPGSVSGSFLWLDSYVNQIWMNNAFQLALMQLLTQQLSIPFNLAGDTQIETALADPINAAVSFGAIRSGVDLSASQIAAVNSAAGAIIAPTLTQRGWYLKAAVAAPAVRQARGPKQLIFWYTDGQSVQQINLSSVALT